MTKIPGQFIVNQGLMQDILLYLQEQPYRQVVGLITEIMKLNEQKQEPENEPGKEEKK